MKKILCVMQLPPPVHGQSVMNKFIADSKKLHKAFHVETIGLHFTNLNNLGSFSFYKIILMIKYFIIILFKIIIFRPNAVYFTLSPLGGAFYRDVIYVCLFKLFPFKKIYHLHGKGIIRYTSTNKILKIIYNFVFYKSHVIHLADCLFSDLKDIDVRYDKYIVENGIKTINTKYQKTKRSSISIVYLSNIVKTKGILDLIEAADILHKRGLIFNLNIVGGRVKGLPKEIFDSKIKGKAYINYLGVKYGQEKYQILNSADIFVLPTFNDCFPLVILEAMQAGLPVISTYEGAIESIVDHNKTGFLVTKRDILSLADRIAYLIEHPEVRIKMGDNGRNKFLNKYTLSNFENRLISVLKCILK